jgi:hypothetical protein
MGWQTRLTGWHGKHGRPSKQTLIQLTRYIGTRHHQTGVRVKGLTLTRTV